MEGAASQVKQRLNGTQRRQALMVRCLYCGENWPETSEFWRWINGRRFGRKCRACRADDQRDAGTAGHVCSLCLAVRIHGPEGLCHGCAGRITGPMTIARLQALMSG